MLFSRLVNRLLGRRSKGANSPPPPRPGQVHTYPRMPKPFAGVNPGFAPTDEEKQARGDYDQSYKPGQRTNNQESEAPNREQIPDIQMFESPYSTWVESFRWERYKGSKVVGRGEGTIFIKFVNGTICQYRNCSYKLFRDLAVAPSKGQFVNTFFKPRPYILDVKGTKKVQRRKPHIGHKFYPPSGKSVPRGRP